MTLTSLSFHPADPYPTYARLREEQPVLQIGNRQWMISRYADALALLGDARCAHWGQGAEGVAGLAPTERAIAHTLAYLTPGNGKPFRKMILHQLAVSSLQFEETGMRAEAQRIWATLAGRSQLDLVSEFAHPFTFSTIARMLGVPDALRQELMQLPGVASGQYLSFIPLAYQTSQTTTDHPFLEGLKALLSFKEKHPGEDLTSKLIELGRGEEQRDFLIPLLLLLFYAGHLNMMNFLGLAVYTLARKPAIQQAFRLQPALISPAIDELIRYDSPLQYLILVTREAIEVRGVKIPAASQLLINVGAANRDPQQFDQPDQIDLQRRPRHLGFGAGAFRCIGARLAQLQAAIGIQSFLDHWPAYEILEEALTWKTQPFIQRGPQVLMIKTLQS